VQKHISVNPGRKPSLPHPGAVPPVGGTVASPGASPWARFKSLLATPVNGASLAALRIAVGLIMALEATSLCRPSVSTSGTIPLETYYTGADIKFHFPYAGFGWLPLLPAHWIYALVGLLALAGVAMALGFYSRAAAAAVFLVWGYLYAVESTRTYWQSYYYLELLFTFLLIWMPAARRYSLDAWIARLRPTPRTVPYWTILLLRGQLVITYFYAGVAKLNADWLLDAAPLRWDLREAHVTAPYEPYLTAAQLDFVKGVLHSEQFAYFLCYSGVVFDLSIGFLLMIRRTRIFALILMFLFHATNHFVIYDNIDWFPLLGVTTALIFLEPDWPERLKGWLRRPRVAKPDWGWFGAGAILFPVLGGALGWKLKAARPVAEASERHRLMPLVPCFVLAWLVGQTLLPIRHYLIPGDGRFTYEGLSFSWRLKADDHRALGVHLFVQDPTIISPDHSGRVRINWKEWHGAKVIYRNVTPGTINWSLLPEIVVLFEPILGERIVYNPFAGSPTPRTEAQSREQVGPIWQKLYGRQPKFVGRTRPLSEVLDSISSALRGGGNTQEAAIVARLAIQSQKFDRNEVEPAQAIKTRSRILAVLKGLRARNPNGEMVSFLQPLNPFTLEGERSGSGPFLVIEDPLLFGGSRQFPRQIDPTLWKNGAYIADSRSRSNVEANDDPLVIYMGNVGADAKDALPQAGIMDSQDFPERAPYIWWNCLKDLTPSKFMHVSNQPFYLRRYALRVASLWEKDYGRRPAVHALTAVSLNGRPHQLLVDPDADLASVPLTWFGHNAWIRDLETERIPREALVGQRSD
jgi:vitamin K-dependent gamma-carboxylase